MSDSQNTAQVILACDIGGTSIKSALFQDGEILRELPQVSSNSGGSITQIADAIEKVCRQAENFDSVAASIPGPFDYAHGISLMEHKFSAVKGVCLTPFFGGKEVRYVHDANAFLLGEVHFGCGQNTDRVFGITLGTGIGAAYFKNGKLCCNKLGSPADEVSLWNKPYCGGIVEDFLSTRSLYEGVAPELQNKEFLATRDGSERLLRYRDILADLLAEVKKQFAPQQIIIGGQISGDKRIFEGKMEKTGAVRTGLGTKAALYGAASLYWRKNA